MTHQEISENFNVTVEQIGNLLGMTTYNVMFIGKASPKSGRLPYGKSIQFMVQCHDNDKKLRLLQSKPFGIAADPKDFENAVTQAVDEFEKNKHPNNLLPT